MNTDCIPWEQVPVWVRPRSSWQNYSENAEKNDKDLHLSEETERRCFLPPPFLVFSLYVLVVKLCSVFCKASDFIGAPPETRLVAEPLAVIPLRFAVREPDRFPGGWCDKCDMHFC